MIYNLYFPVKITPIKPPQVHLTPLDFEIPHPEGKAPFVGREWLFRELEMVIISLCSRLHLPIPLTYMFLLVFLNYKNYLNLFYKIWLLGCHNSH